MLEKDFQSALIKDLKQRFEGCFVFKTDPSYIQGFPDLIVLYNNRWAALECKKSRQSTHRPNQEYYIHSLNAVGFARFIYPENKEEVLDELQLAFES